jgi:hypothetical protein
MKRKSIISAMRSLRVCATTRMRRASAKSICREKHRREASSPGQDMTRLFDACLCLRELSQCLFDLHNIGREEVKTSLPGFVGLVVEYAEQSAIAFRRFWKVLPYVISRMPS